MQMLDRQQAPGLFLRQDHGQLDLVRRAHQFEFRPFFFEGVGVKELEAAHGLSAGASGKLFHVL